MIKKPEKWGAWKPTCCPERIRLKERMALHPGLRAAGAEERERVPSADTIRSYE